VEMFEGGNEPLAVPLTAHNNARYEVSIARRPLVDSHCISLDRIQVV
jgi:hypothetical protein